MPRITVPTAEEILGLYFPVLDNGFVALVDYMGGDAAIERAARVSYGAGTRATSETRGLIRYLKRHAHTSPFEMAEVTLHCCMPIFVARQWIRHRTACLAGGSLLSFDEPAAIKKGKRKHQTCSIEDLHRLWHEGTQHAIGKHKPTFVERVSVDIEYTVAELSKLVGRRPESIRNMILQGHLQATRRPVDDPRMPSWHVSGAQWHAWAATQHVAHVSMRQRLQARLLRCCNEETGQITTTRIKDIWQSGVKPVLKVTLDNGYQLEMTKDHRCFTDAGWRTLEQATGLKVTRSGSVVWNAESPRFATNGVPAYQDRGWLSQRRGEGLDLNGIASASGVTRHTIRKWLKKFGLQYSANERSALSGATQKGQKRPPQGPRVLSEVHVANIRKARSGAASNFWRGGVSSDRANIGRWTIEHAQRTHAKHGFKCVVCSIGKTLNAHHVDPVWHNIDRARDESNLISLCKDCHSAVHRLNLELEFMAAVDAGQDLASFFDGREHQPRHPDKNLPAKPEMRKWCAIASIEYVGEKMTYDLEVDGPWHNFVANGFIVHNSLNEQSARYSLMPMVFYTPEQENLQLQSKDNKQGRTGEGLKQGHYDEIVTNWDAGRELAVRNYSKLNRDGIARELARINLPLSTYTQWYWKIDLHNLMHFLSLRCDSHAQYEIRAFANVMAGMLQRVAPLSFEAWVDYDLTAQTFSRQELEILSHSAPLLTDQQLQDTYGISSRETKELRAKLEVKEVPNFTLDLSAAKTAEHFEKLFTESVPK